jgi:hypothetical protein
MKVLYYETEHYESRRRTTLRSQRGPLRGGLERREESSSVRPSQVGFHPVNSASPFQLLNTDGRRARMNQESKQLMRRIGRSCQSRSAEPRTSNAGLERSPVL